MKLIGHRGVAAHAPENTLPSLEAALAAGVFGVEWDVRVARCGTPVVFHDRTLPRTTDGTGPLDAHTFEALQTLDAGVWFADRFRGTRIPSLEDALNQTLHPLGGTPRVRVYPELKAVQQIGDLDRIAAILHDTGALDRITVISMDPSLLRELRARLPTIELGWVVASEAALPAAVAAVRSDPNAVLDPDATLLLANPARTEAWVREGIPLVTWTVNNANDAHRLLSIGVNHLTTDDPEGLINGVAALTGDSVGA